MRYRTIVADPPLEYEPYPSMPGAAGTIRESIHKPMPYAQMSLSKIAAIPIPDLAADDACLWLWTTNRYLPDAFTLIAGWGFAYRQTVVWNKTGARSPFPAAVAPNHAEYLLYARRGAPTLDTRWRSNVVVAPKQYRHSRKPAVFLDLIEQVSPAPRLELFARTQRLGWDTWGNEALCHVNLDDAQRSSTPEARS